MRRARVLVGVTVASALAAAGVVNTAHAASYLGGRVSPWNTSGSVYCFGGVVVSGNVKSCTPLPSGGPRGQIRFPYPGRTAKCYALNLVDPKAYVSNNFVFSSGGSSGSIYYIC